MVRLLLYFQLACSCERCSFGAISNSGLCTNCIDVMAPCLMIHAYELKCIDFPKDCFMRLINCSQHMRLLSLIYTLHSPHVKNKLTKLNLCLTIVNVLGTHQKLDMQNRLVLHLFVGIMRS